MGAVWGDYDNDGYEDLFLYKWGRPELFHNDGGRHFSRVTEHAGLPPWVNANTAIWFDYDGDGRQSRVFGYATEMPRSEEHTSELQSRPHLVCRLLLEKKKRALIP